MKTCKSCGIEHGQQTPGCKACYMREDYYKRPGKDAARRKLSSNYYQRTKNDPRVREQRARWLLEHPEEARAIRVRATTKYRAQMRAMVDAAKARPCTMCGGEFPPRAMDLHHRDPAAKAFNIGTFVSKSGKAGHGESRAEALAREIAKCDVLCANCHRLHHG